MQPKLPFHEWLIISLMISIMILLTFLTYVNDEIPITGQPHYIIPQEIRVSIQGAVTYPGRYTLKRNACLGDALALAVPLPEADLSKLKIDRKLREGQKIEVSAIPMLTVYIEGAVENPGAFQVPKGTVLQDLAQYVHFLPEANLKPLQKKRKVKAGEIIIVKEI